MFRRNDVILNLDCNCCAQFHSPQRGTDAGSDDLEPTTPRPLGGRARSGAFGSGGSGGSGEASGEREAPTSRYAD